MNTSSLTSCREFGMLTSCHILSLKARFADASGASLRHLPFENAPSRMRMRRKICQFSQTIPNFRICPPNSIVLSGGDSAQEPELEAQLAAMEFDTPAAWCDAEDVMDTVRVCDNEDIACMATPSSISSIAFLASLILASNFAKLYVPLSDRSIRDRDAGDLRLCSFPCLSLSPSLSTTMGLSGIWKLLHHAVENHNIIQYTTAECFKNGAQDCHPMIIGIDASIWMYQVTTALNYRNTRRGPNPAMQVIYHRLVALLQIAAVFVFVFDGPERRDIKRGTRAPGEADAELGRLSAEGIIHTVQTTDSDVFLFGAQRVMYTPKKKTDGDNIKIYTLENIFISPSIGLTRGGLLLFALLAGGDYDPGCPGCGAKTAHAIARGSLGDTLLHAASQNPFPTAKFAAFLARWKHDLCQEFLEDPHGLLGRKYKSISQIIADSDFPNADVIFSYVHPVTSYSPHHILPPHHTWSLATPDVQKIAQFCQLRFSWEASTVAAKFSKGLFPGVAFQSLLKPYDLHALLEAHLEMGLSTDADDFPRSSVLRVLKTKTATYHGQSLLLYQVEMSAGAVSLRAKAGLTDTSAFVTPAAMCKWIPAAIIDYALPGLLSRSRLATRRPRSTGKSHTRKPVHKASAVASSSATTLELLSDSTLSDSMFSDSTLSGSEIIDLTWLD
ncbi:hypothetical protein R3P38DRAFT_3292357 [Favolaschia claudopus]|uniref:XPG-I domain-containing protein n=1 Tax=Favolaschia claudopus TaxID=2862362 RepID=A0AAV9ZJY8_9AGAR